MSEWESEAELMGLVQEELYTPVVSDQLDRMECYHQFLPSAIKPIQDDYSVVGRAMPVLMADVYGPQDKPFGLMTEALDQLQDREIYVATGGTMRCAYWGEILTATARQRKAAGAVIDGYHRDTYRVLDQSWPVFSRGSWGRDSRVRTQVVDYRCMIEIGSVRIKSGDLIFGDCDGVVVIPREHEEEVISKALSKVREERVVRREIEDGMSSTKAFEKYGIL